MTISLKTMMLGAACAVLVALPMVGAAEAEPGAKRGDREVVFVERTGPFHQIAARRAARVATHRINRRLDRQSRRIRAGRSMGNLTRFEALHLRGRLAAIRASLRFARIDGRVSPRERRHLNRMLNTNAERIARLSGNGRFR